MKDETEKSDASLLSHSTGHLGGLIRWLLGDLPQDLVGITIGDWLHEVRVRNLTVLSERSNELLDARGISMGARQVDPAFVGPLLLEAANECDADLMEIWARLLAASMGPPASAFVHRSLIDLAKQLDAIDARTLNFIYEKPGRLSYKGVVPSEIANSLGCPYFEIRVSLQHLERLKCVFKSGSGSSNSEERYSLDQIGETLLRALHPDEIFDRPMRTG